MKEIKKEAYPIILKVINDAEMMLSKLIGSSVKLSILTGEIKLAQSEVNKLRLQQLVCSEFGLTWHEMRSTSRTKEIADARKVYSYIACEILNQSLSETAHDLDKDHTSVIYLRNTCCDLIHSNDPIFLRIQTIKNKLYENIH